MLKLHWSEGVAHYLSKATSPVCRLKGGCYSVTMMLPSLPVPGLSQCAFEAGVSACGWSTFVPRTGGSSCKLDNLPLGIASSVSTRSVSSTSNSRDLNFQNRPPWIIILLAMRWFACGIALTLEATRKFQKTNQKDILWSKQLCMLKNGGRGSISGILA